MPAFRLPLSGDVNQSINPWTWFQHLVGNTFGLVNINLGKSSDPALEAEILEEVGSYGRQIGQLGDALRVVLQLLNLSGLSEEQRRAVDALHFQLGEIDRLKARRAVIVQARDAKVASQG